MQSKRGLGMEAGAASGSSGPGEKRQREKRQRMAFGKLDPNHRPPGPPQAPSRYMSEGMRAQVVRDAEERRKAEQVRFVSPAIDLSGD